MGWCGERRWPWSDTKIRSLQLLAVNFPLISAGSCWVFFVFPSQTSWRLFWWTGSTGTAQWECDYVTNYESTINCQTVHLIRIWKGNGFVYFAFFFNQKICFLLEVRRKVFCQISVSQPLCEFTLVFRCQSCEELLICMTSVILCWTSKFFVLVFCLTNQQKSDVCLSEIFLAWQRYWCTLWCHRGLNCAF